MDLVDIIAEKRFLGQEFVTWLWFKSEQRGGAVDIPGIGDVVVVFEKHMLLEYGDGDSREKVICQGLQAEMTEARTGLRMGKKLEQARILLGRGEYEWNLTLRASMFDFKSVKPPKTMAGSEESDGDEYLYYQWIVANDRCAYTLAAWGLSSQKDVARDLVRRRRHEPGADLRPPLRCGPNRRSAKVGTQ